MKKISFVFLLLLATSANAQKADYIAEINQQVWKPFIEAFNNDDDERFSSVHSKEVTRVEQDGNRIYGFEQYFKKVPDSIKAKWGKRKKNIELRFLQRIASAEKAFEVGYYKTSSTDLATGKTRTGYGKFHVLLRKENGTWKILMDADAYENTDEAIFQSGRPME
jgi:ketosteroid isomerase-like protein